MKKIVNLLKNILGLISIISIIGIIVFGFIDNFSMFFLSTSLAIISLPWTLNSTNKQVIHIEFDNKNKENLNDLSDIFVNKSVIPLLFIGWLYLLNRFVELPVIALYIELIWVFYIIGLIVISVYEFFKKRKTISEKSK